MNDNDADPSPVLFDEFLNEYRCGIHSTTDCPGAFVVAVCIFVVVTAATSLVLFYSDHGTKCAGLIAAKADNSHCIAGVAFNAGIGGIRMLDGQIFDSTEAETLSKNNDKIDIFSLSWGPGMTHN